MYDIQIIDIDSADYPEKLRRIANPPKKLYCTGDISLMNSPSIGVVGARKNTVYGKNVALMIGRRLSENNITVVSGLALGIDAYSHEGALEACGKVIGVLGSGIDRMGPQKNRSLMNEGLKNGGLVVSEYTPETCAYKGTFPARNRIISGLSDAVVVVEAGLNSGSLITAKFASDQGKTVYAVPGNINSQLSIGCNLLIRDGAVPLVVIDDIIRDMGIDVNVKDEVINELDDDEKKIFESAGRRGGATVDELSADSGLVPAAVNSIITIMEIKGLVESYAGRIYIGGR